MKDWNSMMKCHSKTLNSLEIQIIVVLLSRVEEETYYAIKVEKKCLKKEATTLKSLLLLAYQHLSQEQLQTNAAGQMQSNYIQCVFMLQCVSFNTCIGFMPMNDLFFNFPVYGFVSYNLYSIMNEIRMSSNKYN